MNLVASVLDSALNTYPLHVEVEQKPYVAMYDKVKAMKDCKEKFKLATLHGYFDLMSEATGDQDYLNLSNVNKPTLDPIEAELADLLARKTPPQGKTTINDVEAVIRAYIASQNFEIPTDEELILSTLPEGSDPTPEELTVVRDSLRVAGLFTVLMAVHTSDKVNEGVVADNLKSITDFAKVATLEAASDVKITTIPLKSGKR